MKYLVIGSSGFVGSYLTEYLIAQGDSVVQYDIKNTHKEDARCAKLYLDDDVDRIIFLAWDVGGAKYLYEGKTQLQQFYNNTKICINSFDQIEDSGKPFLFVSSQLAEECVDAYSVTKRMAELWAIAMGGKVVRLWNVYGNYEPISERSHVISDFVNQALIDGIISMMTDGSEMKRFIYIEDACEGMLHAFETDQKGIFDVANAEPITIMEVAVAISKITQCKISVPVIENRKRLGYIKNKFHDWEAKTSLADGVARTVETFREAVNVPSYR
tara:strand:- start:289 stop:1104 length:816 start_codon:yes stop_codon:yes gene_type:complete